MDKFLPNWNLLKNPFNWAIVVLMLIIAAAAGHLLLSLAGIQPANQSDANAPS